MFTLDKDYSINKRTLKTLFEEKDSLKSGKDFILKNEVLPNLSNVKFNPLLSSKPTLVKATEEDLYENNMGTTLTITVENKIIIACDTRQCSDYTINSRKMTKIYKIGDYFLTTVGFYADGFEIYSKLLFQIKHYESYNKISIASLAHLLYNILYSRRFFPYFTYACLSGYSKGEAKVYCYDPVGSYQETKCRCDGSGSKMIQPLLDSWIMGKNFKGFPGLNFEGALELVKKAFDGCAERDVKTKDYLEIYVIDDSGYKHEYIELRKD